MKRFTLLLFAVLFMIPVSAIAQSVPATVVQPSPSLLAPCSTANATAAVANQVTLTLTPPNGQSVYLCGWDIDAAQDATGNAVTNLSFTSTNLGGWKASYSQPLTVNGDWNRAFYFNIPVKSAAPGTAVTFVSPASQTHVAFTMNAYFYFAP